MSLSTKPRSWRKCLADLYEKEDGPLPDPVPTFGADLITAPSTPVLSSSMAGPDPEFLEQLNLSIRAIGTASIPTCLSAGHIFHDPDDDSDISSDEEDCVPWSPRSFAARCLGKPSIIRDNNLPQQKRKRTAEKEDEHSDQDKRPRKRSRRIAKLKIPSTNSNTSISRQKRQIKSNKQRESAYSPPQTPLPVSQVHSKDQSGSAQSALSPAAEFHTPMQQQPTPEADGSPYRLDLLQKPVWPPPSPTREGTPAG